MSRLVTEPVTRAEATQRAGRAGRVAAGVATSCGPRARKARWPPSPRRDRGGDLTGLGAGAGALGRARRRSALCHPPASGPSGRGTAVLQMLGALDDAGRITAHGRALATLPLHPRLAHMVARGGVTPRCWPPFWPNVTRCAGRRWTCRCACERCATARSSAHAPTIWRAASGKRRAGLPRRPAQSARWTDAAGSPRLSRPHRLRRKGDAPRYVLSGGKGR